MTTGYMITKNIHYILFYCHVSMYFSKCEKEAVTGKKKDKVVYRIEI